MTIRGNPHNYLRANEFANMIRPYHTDTLPGRIAANEFAIMIRPYHTDTLPGRIAANKFAGMIRPYALPNGE